MNALEQNLLFATTFVILLGTIVVLVWQWWRSRGKPDD